MFASIKLGSILGITIRVHVLLLVLVGVLVLRADQVGPVMTALSIAILFGIVLLHELAHSLVAMRFGLRVVDITLWPLGGMARMSEIPESSRIEGWIAVAGPLLNFVLAGLALPVVVWTSLSETAHPGVQALVGYFFTANLLLGGFNLLPAFPMDGGRILRAFFGRKGNWVLATERAVNIGRAVAFLLGLFAFMTWTVLGSQSLVLVLVAVFVWWAGTQELQSVRARHGLDPLAAFRAFAARTTGWSQTQTASEYARAPRPVSSTPPGTGGFSQEEIERLEKFRGPMRTYPPE